MRHGSYSQEPTASFTLGRFNRNSADAILSVMFLPVGFALRFAGFARKKPYSAGGDPTFSIEVRRFGGESSLMQTILRGKSLQTGKYTGKIGVLICEFLRQFSKTATFHGVFRARV